MDIIVQNPILPIGPNNAWLYVPIIPIVSPVAVSSLPVPEVIPPATPKPLLD